MIKKLTLPLVVVAGVFSLAGCHIMPTFQLVTQPAIAVRQNRLLIQVGMTSSKILICVKRLALP